MQFETKKGINTKVKKVVMLLICGFIFASATSSCTPAKKAQVGQDISEYVTKAQVVINKVQAVVNDPRTEAATVFIPGDWDSVTLAKVKAIIEAALPYTQITNDCKAVELEQMLHCIVRHLIEIKKVQGSGL